MHEVTHTHTRIYIYIYIYMFHHRLLLLKVVAVQTVYDKTLVILVHFKGPDYYTKGPKV